ncbi:MAG: polynucleotide kinase-phosphatase [Gammaproteobacteria bacterium]|nr:polynucleotide kinase-phosphatase [Gammaproteobacteria bacterium]
MQLIIPEFSLVALVGISGSGKTFFSKNHFKDSEVISSDYCRGLVSDDENSQEATSDAFDVLYYIAGKRLARKKLTVIDATNVQQEARKPIVALAREYHCLPVAIVLNLSEKTCAARNKARPGRSFGKHVLRNQQSQLRRSMKSLKREGFRYIYVLNSEDEINTLEISRQRLWTNRTNESGPFDIIGDVHGCYSELTTLINQLGYRISENLIRTGESAVSNPDGRKIVFVGDLVDRGPASPQVLALAMNMVKHETAICVPGNHDVKLLKYLRGKKVMLKHGLNLTVEQLQDEPDEFKSEIEQFIDRLISHYVFDDGRLVVAHAGMKESYQGRASGKVRAFALFGETTGEVDEYGLPVRHNWAEEYRGRGTVVYGHTPVPEAVWLNNTICIDTGCVFGGKLTALRYPEKELLSVPAEKVHCEPVRPLNTTEKTGVNPQQDYDDILVLDDIRGKRIVSTRLRQNITVREENSAAALEAMSRFAANPKWLIYLPPTMSPPETSGLADYLEHPAEAFDYYRRNGIPSVICEEKHMGSRAVLIVCQDEDASRKRFGVANEGTGIVYSRTGRAFFDNLELQSALLERIKAALNLSDFWNQHQTDWVCLDTEILPWSFKAIELIKQQYAAVGTSASSTVADVVAALSTTKGEEALTLLNRYTEKQTLIECYKDAYRRYSWPFETLDDIKVAPFHVLATEGQCHADKSHRWHMSTIEQFCRHDKGILSATPLREVTLEDQESCNSAVDWWEGLTGSGGEGMVVKPLDFIPRGKKGLIQPAIKCRGREYLRIIYGPEYTLPENMTRLKKRGLSHKRSLASREFALGIEALERFIRSEPLRYIHECSFGILALESEPVDPRL